MTPVWLASLSKACLVLAAAALWSLTMVAAPTVASAQDRTLSLYNTHTHERLTVTYKRNGRFVQSGLNQLNRFLRDWRRDEVTRIDPDLFDLVWTVYREVGASEPIHVVSAYRSPATNNMLRRRSSGVARNSQHTQGRAMDFFIPGVSAAEIRAAGLRLEGGGVGYYPRSGTPFVHLDTGSVRMWPRMTRAQLQRVFPDGRTIHIPSDGNPLAGYELARRDYERRAGRPAIATSTSVATARNDGDGDIVLPDSDGPGLFQALFGGGDDEDDTASSTATPVATAAVTTPVGAATELAAAELATTEPRAPYAAPAPILPPYARADEPSLAPSAVAGLTVPPPLPAPTIDEIQLAAVVPAQPALPPSQIITASTTTQTDTATAAPGAIASQDEARRALLAALSPQATSPVDTLPPISREEQIAQTVPQPGQIAAIIEARFAERRASEASLAGQVAQALQREPQTTPEPARLDVAEAGPVSRQLLTGNQESLLTPGTVSRTEFDVAIVPEPRVLAPAPLPAPTTGTSTLVASAPTPATSDAAPAEPGLVGSLIAAAFAAQQNPQTAAQDAIATLAAPAPLPSPSAQPTVQTAEPVVASAQPSVGVTGRLYPLDDDLTASLAKQSIRGADHAELIAPSAQTTLTSLAIGSSGFHMGRGFDTSTGFGLSNQ